jgi:hypothetical protein
MEENRNKIKVELEFPISVKIEGGATAEVGEVTLGRLKAKHLKLLPQDMMKKKQIEPVAMLPLIAAITELPEDAVDEIDIGDLMKIVEVMQSFLGLAPSPQTGKK